MVSRFVTTIERELPPIFLVGPKSVFREELQQAFKALHLGVRLIDPLMIEQGREKLPVVSDAAVGIVWIDVPVFSDQQQKYSQAQQMIPFMQNVNVPVFFVAFDVAHARKKKTNTEDPVWASGRIIHQLLKKTTKLVILEYLHVIYPFEGGLSFVQRFIGEKLQHNIQSQILGEFTPLWYQSVIEDVVRTITEPNPTSSRKTGREVVSYHTFETLLRRFLQESKLSSEHINFPFYFESATQHIDTIPVEEMAEEVALAFPKFSITKKTVSSTDENPIILSKKILKKTTSRGNRKNLIFKTIAATILLLVCSYGLLVGIFIHNLYLVKNKAVELSSLESTSQLPVETTTISSAISKVEKINEFIPIPYSAFGFPTDKQDLSSVLSGIKAFSSGAQELQLAQEKVSTGIKKTKQPEGEDGRREFGEAIRLLDSAYQQLSSAQARMVQNGKTMEALFGSPELSGQLRSTIESWREHITMKKTLLEVFHEFLSGGRKSVAIITVDSQVSRPLGGIPRAVSLLTFENGKLLVSQHYSVAELDSMLTGVAEAPLDMKAHTGKESWLLADGGWSIDGPTASRQVSWFLSKQLGMPMDAVWVVSSRALEKLTFTSQPPGGDSQTLLSNATTQYEAGNPALWLDIHKNFVEKGILQSNTQTEDIADQLLLAFSQSESVLYAKDAQFASPLTILGWDGNSVTPSCPTTFISTVCRVEYVFWQEYNKASGLSEKHIGRTQTHSVIVQKTGIKHTHKVVYENKAASPEKSEYQATIKYVLSADSSQEQVFVSGRALSDSELSVTTEFGKKVLTFPVVVPSQKTEEITISYVTPVIPKTQSSLVLYLPKQPGIPPSPLEVSIEYQDSYYPKTVAPKATIDAKKVIFQTSFDTRKIFALGF